MTSWIVVLLLCGVSQIHGFLPLSQSKGISIATSTILDQGHAAPVRHSVRLVTSVTPVNLRPAPMKVAPAQTTPVKPASGQKKPVKPAAVPAELVHFVETSTQIYQPFADFIQFKKNALASLLGTVIRRATSLCLPENCGSLRAPSQRHCCRFQGSCCPLRPIYAIRPTDVPTETIQSTPQHVHPNSEQPVVTQPCIDHVPSELHVTATSAVDAQEPSHALY
ncbi:uncharacterized protein LOC111273668 isoform X2 [Varroa jacobsoni]|uniref:uncharacterized protein LOC111273668 isoform X2 n=1 Tax=Varroa jacobsoni TaxID=62625 RepID=UPI000BF5CD60|nr:uncharacterized protein LOC111273668 isoform X2 [Varroa jacobsoni]